MRFSIRDGGLRFQDDEVVGADLHFEGMGNQRRGRADTLSKVGITISCYCFVCRFLLSV